MRKAEPASVRDEALASRRVRWSMFGMLALVALVLAIQSWYVLDTEQLRASDTEIQALASAQRTSSQRLALLASRLNGSAPAIELHKTLADVRTQADHLDKLLAEHTRSRSHHHRESLERAARDWATQRAGFFALVQSLLDARQRGDGDGVQRDLIAIQDGADRLLTATGVLFEEARLSEQEHRQRTSTLLLVSIGAVTALIVLLAVAVLEPTARYVSRQHAMLEGQADEMRRLALVAEYTANAAMTLDAELRIDWVNAGFTRILGYGLAEVRGQPVSRAVGLGLEDQQVLSSWRERLDRDRQLHGDFRVRAKSGRRLWMAIDMQPVRDASASITGWVVVAADIDDQVRQRQQRRALFEALPTGVLVYAKSGAVLEINQAARTMLGLLEQEVPDHETLSAALEQHGRLVRADMSDYPVAERPLQVTLRTGRGMRGETVGFVRSDGEVSWTLVNTEPLLDDLGAIQGVVACFVDVTQQKVLERKLRDSARMDGLTLLPNRVEVTDRIRAALQRHREQPAYHFAVLFMDFDRFKQVNDSLGHGVGDELLRQIAARLQTGLRPGDAFVRTSDSGQLAARIGGDEFVVLLDDIRGDPDAEVVAGRLLDLLAHPYQIGEHVVQSSVSIGIATATHATDDVDAVLRDADIAMYEAKRTGRGRYVMFEPAMHRRVRDDVSLENDLRDALGKGELFVVYQPLVDLATQALTGMEALVRWHHPVRGMVSPVEFIPVAEAIGLIGRLGDHVLRTACREFASLQAQLGPLAPPTVSVNLSRAQLQEPSLLTDIQEAMHTHGLDPAQVQLEITESLAAQDQAVQAKLGEIRALGVTLALDDFGTGYSSLSCLHELPIDTVKIDRAFVSMAQTSDYHRVLVEATVLVAQTLGMNTVAEGIETQGQAELMLALGCGKGQGYLYSAPMSRDALALWIGGAAMAG